MIRRILLIACLATLMTPTPPLAAQEPRNPVADPGAVVESGRARFTLLTDRMVRMEWAPDGAFVDRASLVFVNRRLPVPEHDVRSEDGWLEISTGAFTLRYREGSGGFGPENLEVRIHTGGVETMWRPGTENEGNLGGTIRTLDGVEGPVDLGRGLLSRDGWALVDDSERPLLDASDWPWAVARPGVGARRGSAEPIGDTAAEGEEGDVATGPRDWYLLTHGHDYTDALTDFTRVAGRIPMPPRFAFGVWWSRYWAYTDTEFMELVEEFDVHDVPLDVLVVDMDWHQTFELRWRTGERDAAGQRKGWTGYTWNPTYFPDPEAFLAWAHGRGLKVPLNLHPASGIQPWEEQYPAMARAMGVDPETEEWIPFRIEDRDFAEAYFRHVIHPLQEQGVDFWWLDWQQWSDTRVPGLTPTMWLNHVFFTEMSRSRPDRRPIIYHRYGGLGNHRYQIGFSGDAASTWEILSFEPEFTATASNVLYGYWSHDIGGHLPGTVSPELYTRWVQFGAFSPVLRTHTTKNPDAERRIWAYPEPHFQAMRGAMRLRVALVPYLYTAARTAHETGVSPVRPLYYHWPEEGQAYERTDQYMFGPDLLVNPVTQPADSVTGLATRSTWLPPGAWVEWPSLERLEGGRTVERRYALDEIPVFARAGAVIPTAPEATRVGARAPDPLVVIVFPGPDGTTSGRLYEDAGDDRGYLEGAYAWTTLEATWSDGGRALEVTVGAREGSYPGMPEARALEIRVPGALPPARVEAGQAHVPWKGAGAEATASGAASGGASWTYDGRRMEVVVRLSPASTAEARTVTLRLPDADPSLTNGVRRTLRRVQRAVDILEELWPEDWPPESLIDLGQTGRRIELRPETAVEELTGLGARLADEVERVRGLEGGEEIIRRAWAVLKTSLTARPAG